MIFNPMYFVFALPALLLGIYAQIKVKSAFSKYSRVRDASGMTGAMAARRILDANGLAHVDVERTGGKLSDHYDPRSKTLRLSSDVYEGATLAAVGVAAHEVGHALQDKIQLRAVAPAHSHGAFGAHRQLAGAHHFLCRPLLPG